MKAAAELAQAILAQEEEEEQNEEERECGHEHKRGADGAACARDAGECARQRDDEQPEKGKKIFALSAKIAEEKRCGEHDAAAEQHGCGDAGPAGIEQVDENEEKEMLEGIIKFGGRRMMALMVWLMRLYSSRSGETTMVWRVKRPMMTMRHQGAPPLARLTMMLRMTQVTKILLRT